MTQEQEDLTKFASVFENAFFIVLVTNQQGIILYVNQAFCKTYGYNTNEVIGKNPKILKSGKLDPEIYKNMWESLNKGIKWEGEFINKKKNGDLTYERAIVFPLEENGTVKYFFSIKEDITEQRLRNKYYQDVEERYSAIFNNAPIGIFISTLEGKIVSVNNSAAKMFGFDDPNEAKEKIIDIKNLYKDSSERANMLTNLLANKNFFTTYEIDFIRKDGSIFTARMTARPIIEDDGKVNYIEGMLEDVTAKKIAEIKLKESERRFKFLSSITFEGILIHINGNFIDCNESFSKISGYTKDEIKDTSLIELLIRDDYKSTAYHNMKKDYAEPYEVVFIGKSGKEIWIELESRNISSNGNNFRVTAVRDITDRKDKDKKIYEQNIALKSLNNLQTKFLSILAHDLKNPIAGLMKLSELHYENLMNEGVFQHLNYSKVLKDTSKGLYEMLQNLLTWGKLQLEGLNLEIKEVNLYDLINKIVTVMTPNLTEKNIEVSIDFDRRLTVKTDENVLMMIFRNLISNAVKFSHKGSTVSIGGMKDNNEASIFVEDYGLGMEQDKLEKLFILGESKVSTKGTANESGTGLGLILCKEFIEKINGIISVSSTPNLGTTFYLTIPDINNE